MTEPKTNRPNRTSSDTTRPHEGGQRKAVVRKRVRKASGASSRGRTAAEASRTGERRRAPRTATPRTATPRTIDPQPSGMPTGAIVGIVTVMIAAAVGTAFFLLSQGNTNSGASQTESNIAQTDTAGAAENADKTTKDKAKSKQADGSAEKAVQPAEQNGTDAAANGEDAPADNDAAGSDATTGEAGQSSGAAASGSAGVSASDGGNNGGSGSAGASDNQDSSGNAAANGAASSTATNDGWIQGEACATDVAESGTVTASEIPLDDSVPQVGLDTRSNPFGHLGDYVEVRYGDVVVRAQVVDYGAYYGGATGIMINPAVFSQFGATSVDDWGRRQVSYRFV